MPVGVLAVVEMVRVELPEPGAARVAGLKDAVAPEGRPLALSATTELNPPATVDVMLPEAELPCVTEREVGPLKEKLPLPGLKTMLNMEWSSIPFGATPV